ncbi:unnamed protein product, partial [Prorocentrum cordatum]
AAAAPLLAGAALAAALGARVCGAALAGSRRRAVLGRLGPRPPCRVACASRGPAPDEHRRWHGRRWREDARHERGRDGEPWGAAPQQRQRGWGVERHGWRPQRDGEPREARQQQRERGWDAERHGWRPQRDGEPRDAPPRQRERGWDAGRPDGLPQRGGQPREAWQQQRPRGWDAGRPDGRPQRGGGWGGRPWGQQRGGPAAVPLDFEVSAQEMGSVSQGLTLQGAQQVLAILKGVKLIENRSWKIPLGWYAIHAGSKLINEERGARTREAWPEVPPEESLPHGAILGLFCVHRHLAPQKCRPGYIWARGPVCHLISKAIELPRPIFCSGGGGLWSLPPWALAEIGKQLPEASVTHFDLSPALPVVLRN